MRHIAVIPESIRRKWDRIAREQLCEAALRLSEENEELARRAYWAEESADMWQQISEREREGQEVGLTISGRAVAVGGNPGVSIDDDPEYRREYVL